LLNLTKEQLEALMPFIDPSRINVAGQSQSDIAANAALLAGALAAMSKEDLLKAIMNTIDADDVTAALTQVFDNALDKVGAMDNDLAEGMMKGVI